jgi:hypothetical protein
MLLYQTTSPKDDSDFAVKFRKAIGSESHWHVPWPLPNMKPTDENTFWSWRSSQGFKGEIWGGNQKHEIDGKTHHGVLLIYFLDSGSFANGGFAVFVDRTYREERTFYFEWKACDHTFERKNIGNCLNKYTCTKCGVSHEIDSSG